MNTSFSRRDFLRSTAAAGAAATLPLAGCAGTASARREQLTLPTSGEGKKALFVFGGWEGHSPVFARDFFVPWMRDVGFDVTVSDNLDVYADADLMSELDVVVQIWTMGQIKEEQEKGLLAAVRNGMGIAGWHGGLGDSFRNNTEYQFMVGGQWVAHPGNIIPHTINITDNDDPITAGISDFTLNSEQYYMHVDPNNKVLATTRFTGEHASWIDGAVMPVAWKRMYGDGRVFYFSVGHKPQEDFAQTPEALEIMRRGIFWASASKGGAPEQLVRPRY